MGTPCATLSTVPTSTTSPVISTMALPTTTEKPILHGTCVAPGWTFWMKSFKTTGNVDLAMKNELRTQYVFCPDDEIEDLQCVESGTQGNPFNRDQCISMGIGCSSTANFTCPMYDIRLYCRCNETSE